MSTDDVRQRLAGHADSEAIGIVITELEARDREIAGLRAENDRVKQAWKDTVRDRTYALSQAKREIAEVREHAAALAEALELYADMPHRDGCECEACAAIAAYRKGSV